MRVAVVVDSRNVFHQVGDLCGKRGRPSVPGVKIALARYGLEVERIHIGLALPRPPDRAALSRAATENEAYRSQILADGGDVLLGELHRKARGKTTEAVEEKMVDVACTVRVTRYVEEIRQGRSDVEGIVVLSQDIDLSPAYAHARESGVPLIVAGRDVVQHRPDPYLLLGPHAYAEMCPSLRLRTGHEIRQALAETLDQGRELSWEVARTGRRPYLIHRPSGMTGVPAGRFTLPSVGDNINLYPVGIGWDEETLGSFPLLVLNVKRPETHPWGVARVLSRTAPLSLRMHSPAGCRWHTAQYPLGGLARDDNAVVLLSEKRIIGPLSRQAGGFDPDTPGTVRVLQALPRGGALAVGADGRRGLLNTQQHVTPGQIMPVVQIDLVAKGPVWAAIGKPLPA